MHTHVYNRILVITAICVSACVCVYIYMYIYIYEILYLTALNIFYLQLYGIRHMVKDHSDSERGNLATTWATLSN